MHAAVAGVAVSRSVFGCGTLPKLRKAAYWLPKVAYKHCHVQPRKLQWL